MKRLIDALALAAALTFTSGGAIALAQEEAPTEAEATPEDRATSFRNVSGPQIEDVPGGALLIGAYGVAWLLVVAYLWRLAGLHRRTAAEVDALRHVLENRSLEAASKERG